MELFVTIVGVPYLSGYQSTSLGLNMHASSCTVLTSLMSKDLLLFANVKDYRKPIKSEKNHSNLNVFFHYEIDNLTLHPPTPLIVSKNFKLHAR
jgi:hypothetical protein